MGKVGVCGHFGHGKNLLNGQTVKTKILYDTLTEIYGAKNVISVDSHKWKIRPFKLLYDCCKMSKFADDVILLPANNGLKVFVPLFLMLKKVLKFKLHYVVIGGWLAEFLNENTWLIRKIKKFDGIYVETNSMKLELQKLGINNVYIVPNFKKLNILKREELIFNQSMPFKFCTFSRVMKEKGIEDAIEAIIEINKEYKEVLCSLDIYGQIDNDYKDEFKKILLDTPNYINYKGEVAFDKSVDVLREYYALLFPTYYEGEGFAGTILDAFAAGLPVIASKWKYNTEIIEHGKTGFIYELHCLDDLKKSVMKIVYNPSQYIEMKVNCINKAELYAPKTAIKPLKRNLYNDMEG